MFLRLNTLLYIEKNVYLQKVIYEMKKTGYSKITDIPKSELENLLAVYGKEKSRTLRTSRAYLRSLGMQINTKGEAMISISPISRTFL